MNLRQTKSQTRNFVQLCISLALLSSCGQALLSPIAGIGKVGEAVAKSIACSIGAAFDLFGENLEFDLDPTFFDSEVKPFVRLNQIATPEAFEIKAPPALKEKLSTLIDTTYEKATALDQQTGPDDLWKSKITRSKAAYRRLMIRGLISISANPVFDKPWHFKQAELMQVKTQANAGSSPKATQEYRFFAITVKFWQPDGRLPSEPVRTEPEAEKGKQSSPPPNPQNVLFCN